MVGDTLWFSRDFSSGDTLWHSLGFEFTVGLGVENSGHFAGFIPKEPFHPTVFAAEERVVLAREKVDGFPIYPSVNEFVAQSRDRNVAIVAAVDQSVVADVISGSAADRAGHGGGNVPVHVSGATGGERSGRALGHFCFGRSAV